MSGHAVRTQSNRPLRSSKNKYVLMCVRLFGIPTFSYSMEFTLASLLNLSRFKFKGMCYFAPLSLPPAQALLVLFITDSGAMDDGSRYARAAG